MCSWVSFLIKLSGTGVKFSEIFKNVFFRTYMNAAANDAIYILELTLEQKNFLLISAINDSDDLLLI